MHLYRNILLNKALKKILAAFYTFLILSTTFISVPTTTFAASTSVCSASTMVNAGDTVKWSAKLAGTGTSVTYTWSGTDSLSGSSTTTTKTYTTAGKKTATITVATTGKKTSSYCYGVAVEVTAGPTNNAPVIVLLGSNPLSYTIGSTFIDPGAVASDVEDGNLTASIVSTSTVSTTTAGTYTITYSVTDSGGLSATVTRTVVVVPAPNTPPTITLVGSNPLTYTIGSGAFVDPGATASDVEDGNLTPNIVTISGVDVTTPGAYSIVYLVTDSGGLSATTTRFVNVVDPVSAIAECEITIPVAVNEIIIWRTTVLGASEHPTYTWSGTDGLSGNTPEVQKTYLTAGNKIGRVVVTADHNAFCQIAIERVATNTPPTITLLGSNPLSYTIGSTFIDPGAVASDVEDGNLTASIVSTSTVSTTTAGTYTITYSVTDSGGLSATVTRTVVVVPAPNTPPTITLVGSNPLTYTIGSGAFVDPGAIATDLEDGNLTSSIATSTNISTTTVGAYTITYSVTDSGGLGATTTRTVNVVNPANTPPVISILGDNPLIYVIGSGSFVDPGATSTDAEDGNLTSSIVASSSVSTTTAGTYEITYSVTDSGGLTAVATRLVVVVPNPNNPIAQCTETITVSAQEIIEWRTTTLAPSEDAVYEWSGTDDLEGNTATVTKMYLTSGLKTATVTVNAKNNASCDISFVRVGTNTPPTITLNGDNPMYVYVGGSFVDPNATANDAEDGNLTSSIVKTGSVDTSVVGTSTLVYSVTDSGGLTASTTRNVVVLPTPACSITVPTVMLSASVVANSPFSHTITASSTSTSALSYNINTSLLPVGVTATTTAGSLVISGTPVASGTYTIPLTITNSCGSFAGNFVLDVTGGGGPGNGHIRFCKVITDETNVIATSTTGLPSGAFSIQTKASTSTVGAIETLNWNTATFTPNTKLISSSVGNDAMCITTGAMAFDTYYYTAEAVTGSGAWGTALYNDQDNAPFNSVFDVYAYDAALFNATSTDDASRQVNSDGQITLTAGHPEHTVVIRNIFDKNFNTAPVITLVGTSTETYTIGSGAFVDKGATAMDAEDGNLTASIIATSTVSTTTAGTYYIVYSVVDSGGLTDVATRTVSVVVAPVVPPTPPTPPGGGGGGGGGIIPTLYINNERLTDLGNGEVMINWDTNLNANSRILYGLASSSASLSTAPLYGYEKSSSLFEDYVLEHGVGISGLEIGKTYYFRAFSTRYSLNAVGKELVFTYGTSTPVSPGIGSCTYLRDFLRKDLPNDTTEMLKLQIFLSKFEGFSNLQATGVFDDATLNAVLEYQERYRGDVLNPWGSNDGTGYVYLLTRKRINETYCQRAFPLNGVQEQEIIDFKAFVDSLNAAGIPNGGIVNPGDEGNRDDLDNIDTGIIGGNPTSTAGTIAVDDKGQSQGQENTDSQGQVAKIRRAIGNTAAVVFALPTSATEGAQEVGVVIGVIALIYLLFTALVTFLFEVKDYDYRTLRTQKITGYIIGCVLAILMSIVLKGYYMILPLGIVTIALCIGLLVLYISNRKKIHQTIKLDLN